MDLIAVAGKPINHSLSPSIWSKFFKKHGILGNYFKIAETNPDILLKFVKDWDIKLLNITAPLKEKFVKYPINTIINKNESISYFDTDSYALENIFSKIKGLEKKNILIVGAGASAKLILNFLYKKTKSITVMNRTAERLKEIKKKYNVNVLEFSNNLTPFDMIISTIPVDFLNGKKFKKNLIYLNLNYALKENNNVTNIDSKLWLFLQAKKAFSLLYGFYPNIYYKKIEEIKPKSISLIGFMGTGKTTLGKKLSDKLDLDFIDLDSLIERKALRTIPSLFKEGEAFFRKIESKVLLDIDLKKPKIIACGGGTIIKKENLSFLKKQTQVTFLYSELKDIKERVGTTSTRPLYSKIDKIYKERSLEYLRACDICFINKDFKKTLENLTYEFKSTRQ